jgi:hypothetical protein
VDSTILLATALIALTGPDGQAIDINPAEIVSLRDAGGEKDGLHSSVHCQINTADGKYIGVVETCATVREKFNVEEKY